MTVGCGNAATGPNIGIEFAEQALLAQAELVVIYFYDARTPCADIRSTMPRPPSVLGPYQARLNEEGRERGITFRINDVPAGQYVVFVDALDINGGNVGTGCTAGQRIFDRQISKIRVVVSGG